MKTDSTILGKFKTVDALSHAYDSLQKEFTKKCQKLSQLQSENCPKKGQPTELDGEFTQQAKAQVSFPQILPSEEVSTAKLDNPSILCEKSAVDPSLSKEEALIEKLVNNDILLRRFVFF